MMENEFEEDLTTQDPVEQADPADGNAGEPESDPDGIAQEPEPEQVDVNILRKQIADKQSFIQTLINEKRQVEAREQYLLQQNNLLVQKVATAPPAYSSGDEYDDLFTDTPAAATSQQPTVVDPRFGAIVEAFEQNTEQQIINTLKAFIDEHPEINATSEKCDPDKNKAFQRALQHLGAGTDVIARNTKNPQLAKDLPELLQMAYKVVFYDDHINGAATKAKVETLKKQRAQETSAANGLTGDPRSAIDDPRSMGARRPKSVASSISEAKRKMMEEAGIL